MGLFALYQHLIATAERVPDQTGLAEYCAISQKLPPPDKFRNSPY